MLRPATGMIELSCEHRRHPVDPRASFLVDCAKRRFSIEALRWDHDSRPVCQGGQVAHDTSEAMIERHRHANAISRGVSQKLTDEKTVVQNVVMRQRGAFRCAGRSGRVLDVGRIVELQAPLAIIQRERRTPASAFEQLGPLQTAWGALAGAEVYDVPK